MIIIDEYPINAVEIGFQQLMMITLPNYHLPSRNTIMNQLLKDMADYESRMTNRFVNLEFITLVIDAWSNRRMQSFIGVVAHGIHKTKQQQETFVVECEFFIGRHTHDRIAGYIVKFIEKFDIVDKLVRISTDSAAVMRKAFKDLLVISEVEDSQEDILPLDNASDLIDKLLDDIEPTDHNLVVKAVRAIFLRLTQQMDRSNPLCLLSCSETLSVVSFQMQLSLAPKGSY